MMGQSMGSIGNSRKQQGASDQKKNQPEKNPGQRMSDRQQPEPTKANPQGGVDHGPRSVR
jgi:hypothetical protein